MFKALGSLTGSRPSQKEGQKGRTASGSQLSTPNSISRLVGLVRDGKIQTAMEELARNTGESMTTMCLMAEPSNKSTLLHAAADVGSEEVAKAVIAYTAPSGAVSPLLNAEDKQGARFCILPSAEL